MEQLTSLFAVSMTAALITLVICIAVYILYCIAWKRVLKMYGYKNTWMAWIPFLQYYALADAAIGKKDKVKFLCWDMTPFIFKYWIVLPVIQFFFINNIFLSYAVLIAQIVCLGTVFAYIYADAEEENYDKTKFMGLVSGAFCIVAMVKFLSYDKNKRIGQADVF